MSTHFLNTKYPAGFVPITTLGKEHPEILSERRSRHMIATLTQQPKSVQKIFKKRFGRWMAHIPPLIEYLEMEESLVNSERSA